MDFLCIYVYVKISTVNKVSIMVKHEGDHQKRAVGEDRLLMLPREHTAHMRSAARQTQQQRTRNADAVARARSVARRIGNR
jgi:hypothetical protein